MQRKAVQAGLIMGGIAVALFLIPIILQTGMYVNWGIGILSFVVVIVVLALLAVQQRRSMDNVMNFTQAFIFMLIAWVVYLVINNGFLLLYGNVLAPNYPGQLVAQTISQTQEMTQGRMSDSQAMDTMSQIKSSILKQFTLLGALKSMGYWVLLGAVISAVMALFIRKEPEA